MCIYFGVSKISATSQKFLSFSKKVQIFKLLARISIERFFNKIFVSKLDFFQNFLTMSQLEFVVFHSWLQVPKILTQHSLQKPNKNMWSKVLWFLKIGNKNNKIPVESCFPHKMKLVWKFPYKANSVSHKKKFPDLGGESKLTSTVNSLHVSESFVHVKFPGSGRQRDKFLAEVYLKTCWNELETNLWNQKKGSSP